MNADTPDAASADLRIRIHDTNGLTSTFIQTEPVIIHQVLDDFQPAQIFNQDKIVIADSLAHTTFSARRVTRIDLDSPLLADVPFPKGYVEAFELTEHQFQALLRNPIMNERWKRLDFDNKSMVVLLEIIMAGTDSVLLSMEMNIDSTPYFDEMRAYILGHSGLCFRKQNGGIAVLNLDNLVRLTFFPGTADNPVNAWPARFFRGMLASSAELATEESPQPDLTS